MKYVTHLLRKELSFYQGIIDRSAKLYIEGKISEEQSTSDMLESVSIYNEISEAINILNAHDKGRKSKETDT
jgi:hypothetical protein